MNVSVTLFADLRRFGPRDQAAPLAVDVEEGGTVEDLLTAIGLPADEELRCEITVGLNGELGRRDSALHEGDQVVLFSPMEGG